jgi:carbon monoxide dehydrogenase subunit G
VKFDGTFTIEDVTLEEVWLALSDPYMIKQALPGCQFLTEVDDPGEVDFEALRAASGAEADPPILPEATPEEIAERAFVEGGHYAALMEIRVGNISPRFRTVVTVDEREMPTMAASGVGEASHSSFETSTRMELVEHDNGIDIQWEAEADVFGKIAEMGQRVINPIANRIVGRFFGAVEDRLVEVADEENTSGIRKRVRDLL